jgi:hypothetical protein
MQYPNFPDKSEDEFKAWLRSLPPETKFCQTGRCASCPIAQFTGIETWMFRSSSIPQWADRFMDRYDEIQGETLQQALDCITG